MSEITIKDSLYGYFITPQRAPMDNIVAQNLGMTEKKYQNLLIKQFNGERGFAATIYFKNKEDANKALEWVESMMVMNELRGAE